MSWSTASRSRPACSTSALYFFHNARALLEIGAGPYFYLPKMESHLEARLWNDVFNVAQDAIGIRRGTIRATVLIETLPAAFEMEEILYELRDHAAGLNAGRWDYIFSAIKTFRDRPDKLLPDRAQVTMTVPFMRSYTQLLVKTCHKRGAHAIGGMAAFIPSRRDAKVNEIAFARVREDKEREAGDGFDGTWVAHPGLVPIALEIFDRVLGDRPNQKGHARARMSRSRAGRLTDFQVSGGTITEGGRAHQHQRGPAVHQRLAARDRRRRDLQPDGGRRHRRDLPRPALAVDPPRCSHRGRHSRSLASAMRRSGTKN